MHICVIIIFVYFSICQFVYLVYFSTVCFFGSAPTETYISRLLSTVARCGLHHWIEHEKLDLYLNSTVITLNVTTVGTYQQCQYSQSHDKEFVHYFLFSNCETS